MISEDNRTAVLNMITPDTELDESLAKIIYGLDLDDPGFHAEAMDKLESVGLDDARGWYAAWVDEYQDKQSEEMEKAADWREDQEKYKAVCDDGVARPLNAHKSLEVISALDLSRKVLEPVSYYVENLIPQGLTLFSGSPKIGKSWLALDLGARVASGSDFLGFKTSKCTVLYLALEDSENRLQTRLDQIMGNAEPPDNFFIVTRADSLKNGLLDQLEDFFEENPETGLIMIDTFQKVRSGGGRDNLYANDYREVGQLKQFADEHKIAVLLIHHTRKMKDPSDPFADISGTTGLSGAADTMIVLSKDDRNNETAKMSVTGRDVESQEYEMEFKDFRWHIIGTPDEVAERKARDEYNQNPVVLTVKKLLDQYGGIWTGSAKELKAFSRTFNTPIDGTEMMLGKSLGQLADVLFQYDRIIYTPIKNGNAGRKHRFQYQQNPFDVTDDGFVDAPENPFDVTVYKSTVDTVDNR